MGHFCYSSWTNSEYRVSRSIRDLSRIADVFEDAGTKLEFKNEPIEIDPASDDPYSKAMFQLVGVFAELEAEITRHGSVQISFFRYILT